MEVHEKLIAYLHAHKKEMLFLWKKLVETESGPQQPSGVEAVRRILEGELAAMGFTVRLQQISGAPDLLIAEAGKREGEGSIILSGHIDTVFPAGKASTHPFFVDDEGYAHGPGVLDMKGGLVVSLYAVKALNALSLVTHPIKFVFVTDEETLHMHSNAKAVLRMEITGARAFLNFEPCAENSQVVLSRYGGGPVSIHVHGRAAHSGTSPEKGRSAILEAAHKILYLESQNDIPRGKLINCGAISGGIGENTIPGECTLRIGVRYRTESLAQEIKENLKEATVNQTVPDTSANLDLTHLIPAMDLKEGGKALFLKLQEAAALCSIGPIKGIQVGGLSDAGLAASLGIPTLCGMGVVGSGAHTDEEKALVSSLYERTELAAALLHLF